MNDLTLTNSAITRLRLELTRAQAALKDAQAYLTAQAQASAALSCTSIERALPPLHTVVTLAITGIETALVETAPDNNRTPRRAGVRTMKGSAG
ncbi:hypothetical protein AB0L66_10660 [Streptomyces sp. NPDC052207]|uniref:hypothetical protein n=1 Tax=Streptomyces sp. NPDC052207 TaxID=3155418 RepID=UPI00344243AF